METIHAEDITKVESALSGRGDFDLEYRIVLPDKSIRWVRDRGFVVRNEIGQVSRVIGMAEDVTSQKNTEKKLEQSVDLLAALFDKLGSGVLVENEELRVSHVNKEFFELLKIDEPGENVAGSSSGRLFAQSNISARRIEAIRSGGIPIVDEEFERNGSVLKLSYVPLIISRIRRYHLWQFREDPEEVESDGLEEMEQSLHTKDALLRETYQAVKNDLQVIYGVLKLQSGRVQDRKIRSYFVADQTRVMAIALVHERLSKSDDLGSVDFPGYARNLAEQLIRSYFPDSQDIQIRFDLAPIPMRLKTAIPCGLIINELVTNSLRYAFPDRRQGEILIRFGQLDEHNFRLTVRDNGVGLPKGLDFKNTSTLGLTLVTGLAEQLGGTIAMQNQDGTEFNISFPSDGNQPTQAMAPAPAETYQSRQAQRVS
jgi:two-component sensor histidine kinase